LSLPALPFFPFSAPLSLVLFPCYTSNRRPHSKQFSSEEPRLGEFCPPFPPHRAATPLFFLLVAGDKPPFFPKSSDQWLFFFCFLSPTAIAVRRRDPPFFSGGFFPFFFLPPTGAFFFFPNNYQLLFFFPPEVSSPIPIPLRRFFRRLWRPITDPFSFPSPALFFLSGAPLLLGRTIFFPEPLFEVLGSFAPWLGDLTDDRPRVQIPFPSDGFPRCPPSSQVLVPVRDYVFFSPSVRRRIHARFFFFPFSSPGPSVQVPFSLGDVVLSPCAV